MENYKLSKLLNNLMDWSKWFIEWTIFFPPKISFKTPILRSNLYDCNNVHIVPKRRLTVVGSNC